MTSEYKEVLAQGATEIARRSPVVAILVLETLVILWIGWQVVSGNLTERNALRAQNAELTDKLIQCYERRPQQRMSGIIEDALLSAQRDRVP